jgi:hypothetical protein
MSALTSWLRQLGTSGAVVNARSELDRSVLAGRALEEAVARIPAEAPPAVSNPAA